MSVIGVEIGKEREAVNVNPMKRIEGLDEVVKEVEREIEVQVEIEVGLGIEINQRKEKKKDRSPYLGQNQGLGTDIASPLP